MAESEKTEPKWVKNNNRQRLRELKMKANLGLAGLAKVTHFIPEKPRRMVRDQLIRLTTPRDLRPYRVPFQDGRINGKSGINEFGFFRAKNGLAQGAKLYAKAMACSGIPYTLINLGFLDWLEQDDHSLDSLITRRGGYAVNVIHVNPDQWEYACRCFPHRQFDRHYNIGVWAWELETLPASWIPTVDYVDELWASSEFIADAIRKETDKPVTVIRYGIETPVDGSTRADFGLPEDEFLVLAMYDSRSHASRKNPDGAIRAFAEAFPDADAKARLILKVANGKEEEIRRLRETLEQKGVRYHLVTELLEKEHLNALISCCDAFISLHRSEGFGLVVAEAMNLGVPVVATGWSANAEFMPEDCTCRVGYNLVPVGDAYQWGEAGQRWAEPDVHQAAEYLKKIRENPEWARERGEKARDYIRRELSVEKCAQDIRIRYEEIMEELSRRGEIKMTADRTDHPEKPTQEKSDP